MRTNIPEKLLKIVTGRNAINRQSRRQFDDAGANCFQHIDGADNRLRSNNRCRVSHTN